MTTSHHCADCTQPATRRFLYEIGGRLLRIHYACATHSRCAEIHPITVRQESLADLDQPEPNRGSDDQRRNL